MHPPCRCAELSCGGIVIFGTDAFGYGMIVRGIAVVTVTRPGEGDVYGICHDKGGRKENREEEDRKHGRRRNGRKEKE